MSTTYPRLSITYITGCAAPGCLREAAYLVAATPEQPAAVMCGPHSFEAAS